MFNRRFYRVKVFQQLYAYGQDSQSNLTVHEKNMLKSLEKAHELYIYLLSFPVEFRHFLSNELEAQQSRYIRNEDAITQIESLYNNKTILLLEQHEGLLQQIKHYKLKWVQAVDLFKKVWQDIKAFEPFKGYGTKSEHTFFEDRMMLSDIMQLLIADNELLNSFIEERFINWEDDQTLILANLIKQFDQLKENKPDALQPAFAPDKEALLFMSELFRKTIEHHDELTQIIAEKTQNWDTERIAFSDLLLMRMALCEMMYFPYIPVKLSINEYLELAKLYSTPQSHGFINGVLDKIQIDMRKQEKIVKLGRGLVE